MKVALSQHTPAFLDLQSSLEKAVGIMEEASKQQCDLLVFGETWLTGYPVWLDHIPGVAYWDHEPTKQVYAQMHEQSLTIPGPALTFLQDHARKLKINVCMGLNEKVAADKGHGTIYNAFVIINSKGELVHHHRKLMPTYTEKMLYGLGDARGIKSVSLEGWNVSGLICWEHWMPLSRQALHDSGEQIHIALWPRVHEMHQIASRHYAFEGRCYVLAVGQILEASQLPQVLVSDINFDQDQLLLNGGSCIIGPNGKYLQPPVFDQECLVVDTLDLNAIRKEQMTLDVTGHYARPDVFDFQVKR